MKCPNCGSEILDPTYRFCPECRTRLPKVENPTEQPAEAEGQTCPTCGTTGIDPSFRFCPNCRTRMQPAAQKEAGNAPDEKGFLNRLFMTYEKAVANPAKFKEWAKANPNDSAVLLAKWSREGKDISMFSAVNPSSDEFIAAREAASTAASSESAPSDKKKKKDDKEEQEAERQATARVRENFSAATGGAADLIKGKAIWNVVPGEVARHITAREFEEISDNLDGVLVEEGTSAIIYVDGAEVAQLSSGLYVFATEKVTKEVTDEIAKEEKMENRGLVRRIVRFFMGSKKGEDAKKREEKKKRVRELTRRITGRSVVSVYLKADGLFPAMFGVMENDGGLRFEPYTIATAHLDVKVGANIQFRLADFKQFIANFMQGKESVFVADIQKAADPVVKSIIRHQLRMVEVDERGIPPQAMEVLESALKGIKDVLPGIEVPRVIEITTDNDDFDRFRSVERRLYTSEREYDYLRRTNEFQNRLESEKNRQLVAEARTELELQAALDEVNKDHLLHDEEMEEFRRHYRNMQAIRQATSDLELERALLGLKSDALVSEDDFEAIEEGLKNKKFEREQLSEVLRMRSLANTSLAKITIEADLLKAQINAQGEVDDAAWEAHKADMGRNAEEVDLEAAIYGRKIVLEKKQLSDAIELDRMQAEYRDERRIREADVDNELLDRKLAGQQKAEDMEFARRVRDYEHEHGKKADEIELERMRRQVEYDFERARKMDDAELLEREQKGAMEMMRQMQEQERLAAQDRYAHEENLLQTKAGMSEGQLTAEQLQHLDKDAQLAYMKAQESRKEAELLKENEIRRERDEAERVRRFEEERQAAERARKEDRDYTKSLLETLAGALGGNVAAQAAERKAERESYERVATHRINEVDAMKEEYRDQMRHEQSRLDSTTDTALNYTSRVSAAEASGGKKKDLNTCPRCHGELVGKGFCPRCGWPDED